MKVFFSCFLQFIAVLLLYQIPPTKGANKISGSDDPIVIDLSGTRSWEEVSASGFEFSELKGFTHRKAFHLPPAFVAWKFPGGTTFQHHMTLGSLDYVDGQLRFMSSHGEMMPLDEVMVLARRLHMLLGQPTERLEKWTEKGVSRRGFLTTRRSAAGSGHAASSTH